MLKLKLQYFALVVQWLRLCISNAGAQVPPLVGELSSYILVAQLVKNPPAMSETWVQSLGWEDPLGRERLPTGEGKGFPLQYSDLGNSRNCVVHGVTNSWNDLSDFHFHFTYWVEGPNKNIINKQSDIW